jgi:hypothetical protein
MKMKCVERNSQGPVAESERMQNDKNKKQASGQTHRNKN